MVELWIKVSVEFFSHPKAIEAGADAALLFLAGTAYCRKHMTDGVIPRSVLPGLCVAVKRPAAQAKRLIDAGLWLEHPSGYRVHDYHVWNPTKATIEAKRQKWRDDKRTHDSTTDSEVEQVVEQPVDSVSVSAPTSEPVPHVGGRAGTLSSVTVDSGDGSEGGVGETEPVWRNEPRPSPLVQSRRTHAGCYHAPMACGRGLCVPMFLGQRWEAQAAEGVVPGADYVATFIKTTLQFTPCTPQGDALKWWDAKWDEKHRPVKVGHRPAAQVASPDWASECQQHHNSECDSRYTHGKRMQREAVNA